MSANEPQVMGHGLLMPTPGVRPADGAGDWSGTERALAVQSSTQLAQLTDHKTREAWLAARQSGVGASESAALYDLSPWESRHSLWLKKTGRLSQALLADIEEAEWLMAGRVLENGIAELYSWQTKREIWAGSAFCIGQHPRVPHMIATPDRMILKAPDRPGQQGSLQVKMRVAGDWSDGPPLYVQCQVQHEMAVTGVDYGAVTLYDHGRLLHWDIERQPAFIAQLEADVEEFWHLVATNTPPAIDGHKATLAAIKKLHPLDNGQTIELPPEACQWFESLQSAKAAAKAAETAQNEAEAKLRDAIGVSTFARLPGGPLLKLAHTTVAPRTQTVDGYTFRQLRVSKEPDATPKARKSARKAK